MRVAGNNTQGPSLVLDKGQRSERAGETKGATAPATDTVGQSEASGAVRQALATDDVARAARIAEVKAQIESGGYPLDFAALAERMIDDELGRGVP
ncbi:MAG: flagellar biosynthesis anti-sigma factor FlgM [Myxococcota bacterium]